MNAARLTLTIPRKPLLAIARAAEQHALEVDRVEYKRDTPHVLLSVALPIGTSLTVIDAFLRTLGARLAPTRSEREAPHA